MGIVILGASEQTEEQHVRKNLQKLLRVGGRLAVLGVEDGRRAMGWWHIAQPGNTSDAVNAAGPNGETLHYSKAVCGRRIVTNGYAADWRPADGVLCPACRERL